MRVAHVIMTCAALISAFHRAKAMHPVRKPQSKDHFTHVLQPRSANLPISEITFTTLKPEVTSFNQTGHPSHDDKKKSSNTRQNRSMAPQSRNPIGMNASRRRRQLQKYGANSSKVGRSFEVSDNHVDHHIESVQPLDAFDEGAIHLEPVYRVTKNKGVLDSLIGILRRLVDPPKSVGPLVGPFPFPGLGDKVYVRLLEQTEPDNLVIRLISHLPAGEVVSFDKNLHPPSGDLPSHPEIVTHDLKTHFKFPAKSHSEFPIISHDLLSHPKNPSISHDLKSHSDFSIISHDLLSNSKLPVGHELLSQSEYASISKESLPLSIEGFKNSYDKDSSSLASSTNSNSKSSINDVVRVPKSPNILSSGSGHKQPCISRTYSVNLKNGEPVSVKRVVRHRNRNQYLPPAAKDLSNFNPSPRLEPDEPRNSSQNGWQHQANVFQDSYEVPYQFHSRWNESNRGTPSNIQVSMNSANASSPVYPLKNPISNLPRVENKSDEHAGDGPRYSLKFFSKKMSYLNLDGSVYTPGETPSIDYGFKPMEPTPAGPKVARSVGGQTEVFHSSSRMEPSNSMREHRGPREKSNADKRSSGNDSNFSASSAASKNGSRQTTECAKCSREKNENGDKHRLPGANNSTQAGGLQKQLSPLQRQMESKRNLDKLRGV